MKGGDTISYNDEIVSHTGYVYTARDRLERRLVAQFGIHPASCWMAGKSELSKITAFDTYEIIECKTCGWYGWRTFDLE